MRAQLEKQTEVVRVSKKQEGIELNCRRIAMAVLVLLLVLVKSGEYGNKEI